MECDVAVLGGGPGGYTAAIRAAQLGAKSVCIELELQSSAALCLRVGCIPTKAWVQTAHAFHQADEVFAKFGVNVSKPELDFGQAVEWKNGVVKPDDRRRGEPLQGERRRVGQGHAAASRTRTRSRSRAARTSPFKSAIVATGSFPLRPPIDGLDSPRCVDSTGLLAQTEVPRRLVVLGGGIIGCEFASIFQRFGSEVTIVEMLRHADPAGGRRRGQGAREAVRQARDRAPARQAVHRRSRTTGSQLTVHFGEGETCRGRPDARLRRPRRRSSRASGSRRSASSSTSARGSPPTSTAARPSRTSTRVGDCAGYWQLAHTAFREGEVAAENALGHEATIGEPRACRGRSTPTRRSPASA